MSADEELAVVLIEEVSDTSQLEKFIYGIGKPEVYTLDKVVNQYYKLYEALVDTDNSPIYARHVIHLIRAIGNFKVICDIMNCESENMCNFEAGRTAFNITIEYGNNDYIKTRGSGIHHMCDEDEASQFMLILNRFIKLRKKDFTVFGKDKRKVANATVEE